MSYKQKSFFASIQDQNVSTFKWFEIFRCVIQIKPNVTFQVMMEVQSEGYYKCRWKMTAKEVFIVQLANLQVVGWHMKQSAQ